MALQADAGVVLQADLVGFTPLAASMSRDGPRGIERLHALLDGTFAAMTGAVEDRGGRVVAFAGDALTAVFTGEPLATTRSQGLAAARDLLAVQDPTWSSPRGSPSFRVGLGSGRVLLTDLRLASLDAPPTAGPLVPGRRDFVVTGSAVDAAGSAVRRAAPGCGLTSWSARAVHPSDRPLTVPAADPSMGAHHRVVTTAFVHVDRAMIARPRPAGGPGGRTLLGEAAGIVARHGGDLRQIEGRGAEIVLVLGFGAPRSDPDDVVHAVACARDLLALGREHGLRARAGLATGETFCAELGGPGHREYVVVGDSVNQAARLAQSARPGEVRIDGVTARGAREKGRFSTRSLGRLRLKGRDAQIAYAVRRDGGRPRLASGSEPPRRSVGRSVEVARLRDLAAVDREGPDGRGRVVLLTGEAGIGTSHLLRLVRGRLSGLVAAGSGCAADRTPYLPWRTIWAELGDDASLAGLPGADRELHPLLATALGTPTPDTEATRRLSPEDRAGATRRLLSDLLRRACARHGRVTILLDDADDLDELSGRLLTEVARLTQTHPLALVVAARGPLDSLAGAGVVLDRLVVGPLDGAAARLLAADLLGPGHPRLEAVAARSGGNPLFLRHLAHWTRERDAAERAGAGRGADDDERVDAGGERGEDDEPLPTDVRRVVLARLDALGPGEQSLVYAAAVAGRTGTLDVLGACARAAGVPLRDEEAPLPDADWPGSPGGLLVRGGDGATFAFADPLVHDVAYATMSLAVRSRLHEVAGDTLEGAGPDPAAPDRAARVELLAHHYGRSGNVGKQRRWIGAAARIAERDYATATALAHLRHLGAIERDDVVARADLWTRQAAVLALLGRRSRAQALLERALEVVDAPAPPTPATPPTPPAPPAGAPDTRPEAGATAARARRDLGALLLSTTRSEDALGLLATAARELEAGGDLEGAAAALDRLAFGHLDHGDLARAEAVARQQIELARRVGSDALVAAASSNLALTARARGSAQRALDLSREAHRRALRSRDRRLLVHTGNDLAGRLLERGEPVEAAARLEEALATARSIGYLGAEVALGGNLGELHRLCGDPDTATALVAAALRAALDLQDCPTVARCVVNLALARLDAGDATARDLATQAAQVAVDLGQPACGQEARAAASATPPTPVTSPTPPTSEAPVTSESATVSMSVSMSVSTGPAPGPSRSGVRLPRPLDLAGPPTPAQIQALVRAAARLAAARDRVGA